MILSKEQILQLIIPSIQRHSSISGRIWEEFNRLDDTDTYIISFTQYLYTVIKYSVVIESSYYNPVKVILVERLLRRIQQLENPRDATITLIESIALAALIKMFYAEVYSILLSIYRSSFRPNRRLVIDLDLPEWVINKIGIMDVCRVDAINYILNENDSSLGIFVGHYSEYYAEKCPNKEELREAVVQDELLLLITILDRYFSSLNHSSKETSARKIYYKGELYLCN